MAGENFAKNIKLSKNNIVREIITEDFKTVRKALGRNPNVELRIIPEFGKNSTTLARVFDGDIIISSEYLAYLPKPQRLYVLGHEFGHIELKHRERMLSFVNDEFNRMSASRVDRGNFDENELSKNVVNFSKKLELEADTFAVTLMRNEPQARDGAEDYAKYNCNTGSENYNSAQIILQNIYRVQGRGYSEEDTECYSVEKRKYLKDNRSLVRHPLVLVRRSGSD